MPCLSTGNKVLVSGANGFIASWLIRTLLEQGYAVRGTVRSLEKGRYLTELFEAYREKFELVVVEDVTKKGAFDEAVKGVDAIAHTASPCHYVADDPQDLIRPALDGTLGILHSAQKNGPSIKRIVVTSSTAAILEARPNPVVLSELDWNNQAVREVEEKGRDAHPFMKYRASKTLAERAAWDFHATNKDKISWDLTVILPPYVFGPAIHEVSSIDKLNESLAQWQNYVVAGGKTEAELKQASSWVNVADLAEAHVRALKEEKAGGERFIVAAGPYVWQHWVDTARKINSSIPPGHPKVVPNSDLDYMIRYDTAKTERILKIAPKGPDGDNMSQRTESETRYYKSMGETTRDILAYFAARGW